MRYVSLKDAEPGMSLAYDVYDSYGRTLISSNAKLTRAYIAKLEKLGFDGVYIQDVLSQDIEIEPVITPELRAEGLASVRTQNIDKCQDVAKDIVEQITTKGKLSLDLTDLRTFDDYTYAHSVNVAVYSCVIGFGLNLEADDLKNLVMASLLHDFGKMSIAAEIINKPELLSAEEFSIMKAHAERSYEMIKNRVGISAQIKQAVLYHHENEDGSGYPHGVEGSELSLYTKILHVADVYDALTSKRPYKRPYSPYEASEYLMGACDIMFDKKVVEAFLRYVPLFPKGTAVRLSDGREAIIFDNTGNRNLRPILRTMDGKMLDLEAPENLNITIVTSTEEIATVTENSENARRQMVHPGKKYHIVAVDDMKSNLIQLNEDLKHLYDLTLLKSGAQALLYLKKNPLPDLILVDIAMPEMNGIETARKIQEITDNKVPILFVTALHDRSTVMQCREVNAAGYIVRPYKLVFLKSEIKRIITGQSDID